MGAGEIGGYVESILDSWSRHQAEVFPDMDAEAWRREGLAHVEAVLHDGVATPGNELLAIHTDSEAVGGRAGAEVGQQATPATCTCTARTVEITTRVRRLLRWRSGCARRACAGSALRWCQVRGISLRCVCR